MVVVGAVGGSAAAFSTEFTENYAIPGTPSNDAVQTLMREFPEEANPLEEAGVTVVFAAPPGKRLEEYSAAMDAVVDTLNADVDKLQPGPRFGNPVEVNKNLQQMVVQQATEGGLPEDLARKDAENLAVVSPDGRIGFTSFTLDIPSPAFVTQEQRDGIWKAMEVGRQAGLQVEAGGAAFGDPLVIKSTSELVGLAVAFVVLVFTFGSVIAAGLPLLTAVVGIAIGATAILLATRWADLNNTTPVLAIMLGLAVGIDYALFIVSRYRSEVEHRRRDEAAGMAVGTAGSAVVFAGLTVIIALVALSVVRIPFLTYMGLAAAFTVAVSVLVALTLVPALLGLLGKHAFGWRIFTPRPSRQRWVRLVHRFPALVLTVVVVSLGLLAIPATRLHLALPTDSTAELGTTQRASAELLEEGFGPGISAPFLMVVDAHSVREDAAALEPLVRAGASKEQAAYLYVTRSMSLNPGVKNAQIIGASDHAAKVLVTPLTGPTDPETERLLHSLRGTQEEIQDATGASIGITGLTPIQQDVTERLATAMPVYLAVVVGLAIVLLLVVFRSVMVPVIAGVGFLLSVGAAFGVTVLFWQEGLWGLVPTPGPLISFMPIFLIGVTFGLAMDYQVFLVSRMREHHVRTVSPRGPFNRLEYSTIMGYGMGARVITAAALIMISVFVAFIDQPLPFIQIFGFALGAGVLFDAFFVRMAFVPAAMFLLGRATWWLPRWLDRIIPQVDVEGSGLEKTHGVPVTLAP